MEKRTYVQISPVGKNENCRLGFLPYQPVNGYLESWTERHPFCVKCLKQDILTDCIPGLGTGVTDHIVPIDKEGAKRDRFNFHTPFLDYQRALPPTLPVYSGRSGHSYRPSAFPIVLLPWCMTGFTITGSWLPTGMRKRGPTVNFCTCFRNTISRVRLRIR